MTDLTLYLLRHGESLANANGVILGQKQDSPLSHTGIHQATMQAQALESIEFSAIYSSPLLRARQTAEIMSQRCNKNPSFTQALQEVNLGVLEGKSVADSRNADIFRGVITKWEKGITHFGFPGGETLHDVVNRLNGFLERFDNNAEKPILVVSHNVIFKVFIWLFCENHGQRFQDGNMGHAHLSIVSSSGDSFRLLKFNIPPDQATQENLQF